MEEKAKWFFRWQAKIEEPLADTIYHFRAPYGLPLEAQYHRLRFARFRILVMAGYDAKLLTRIIDGADSILVNALESLSMAEFNAMSAISELER